MISTSLQQIDMHDGKANLREGWRMVRFGDVVRNIQVNIDPQESGLELYVAGEHMATDNLHIRQWGTIGDGYLGPAFHRKFVKGQVLYGSRRTYLRKVAVAEFDGICANTTFTLEANEDELLQDLLPFIMQTETFTEHSIKQSRGSVNPYINWKDIAWYEFVIPPKDEQRRIADILWAADETILKTKFLQEQIQSFRQNLMQALFDPHTLEREGKSLKLVPLAEVLTYASDGPFGSKLKTEHYTTEGVRVIRLQNIGDGSFDDADKAYISNSYYHDLIRYTVKPGDIIVAGLGDEAHALGRACLIPKDLGLSVNKADCFCLRTNTSIIEQEYLLYFLNSPYARNQVNQLVQGTTRARINVSNLKSIMAIVPGRDSQKKVCHILKSLDTAYAEALSNIQMKRDLALNLREHLLSVKRQINV